MKTQVSEPQVSFLQTISLLSFNGLRRKLAKNSSIYTLDIIFKLVYDVVSRLICIFYPSLELTQTFANGRQRFYSFRKFYVIHLKNQGVKILSQNHFKAIYLVYGECKLTKEQNVPVGFGVVGGRVVGGGRTETEKKTVMNDFLVKN